jgi:hypothetical protein
MADTENVNIWLMGLRSNEYTQTTGYLEKAGNNCCLGVACREAIKEGVDIEVKVVDGITYFDDCHLDLPMKVQQWLGIDAADPFLNGNYATSLNDNDRKSFAYIADEVENHIHGSNREYDDSEED